MSRTHSNAIKRFAAFILGSFCATMSANMLSIIVVKNPLVETTEAPLCPFVPPHPGCAIIEAKQTVIKTVALKVHARRGLKAPQPRQTYSQAMRACLRRPPVLHESIEANRIDGGGHQRTMWPRACSSPFYHQPATVENSLYHSAPGALRIVSCGLGQSTVTRGAHVPNSKMGQRVCANAACRTRSCNRWSSNRRSW